MSELELRSTSQNHNSKIIKMSRARLFICQFRGHKIKLPKFEYQVLRTGKRILDAREAPPVSSFTFASKNGVSALPVIFLSLRIQFHICKTWSEIDNKWQKKLKTKWSWEVSNLASRRAICIADSIKPPEAECSLGIGTAIRVPVPSLSFKLASAINKERKHSYSWFFSFLHGLRVE